MERKSRCQSIILEPLYGMKKILLIVSIVFMWATASICQRAIDIDAVIISEPYPTRLSTYVEELDKILIMIKNNTGRQQEFVLDARVYKDGQLYAFSDISSRSGDESIVPFIFEPGQQDVIAGNDLYNSYGSLDNFLTYVGNDNLNDISLAGTLPEGRYKILITAHDFDTGTILSEGENSNEFLIEMMPPPRFIQPTPFSTTYIPNDISEFLMYWEHDIISADFQDIEYDLKIIELSDALEYDPAFVETIMMPAAQSPADWHFRRENLIERLFNYDLNGDIPLRVNHSYAAQVTAVDRSGNTIFQNDGKSSVVIFSYGDAGFFDEINEYNLEVNYPIAMDTLPISSLPLVLRYVKDDKLDFKEFKHTYKINGAGNYVKAFSRPEGYEDSMSPGEENEESLPYFYMNNGVDIEDILSEGLVRGETYTLSAENITVEYDDDPINLADKSVKFVYGMTEPQPTIPVMRDSLSEPPSSLQFLSGRMPEQLTPPDGYMMGDVPAIEYGESFLTEIKERWVVQLSTSEQFTTDSIVRAYSGLLAMDQETLDGLVIFDEGIYKNVSVDIDTAGLEVDTYYWRVFYMKDPDIEKSPGELKSILESEFYLSLIHI